MLSGYRTYSGGRITRFDLYLDEHETHLSGDDHGPVKIITVDFGDFEVGPSGTFGYCSHVPGGATLRIQQPRDEVHTFWRVIENADHHLGVSIAENDGVVSFLVLSAARLEGETDNGRRERVNSMLERLGEAPGPF